MSASKAVPQTAESERPPHPHTAYNLFYFVAKEQILQQHGHGYAASSPEPDEIDSNHALRPAQFRHLILPKSWWVVEAGRRKRLSTKKNRPPPHGIMTFVEMTKKISEQWKSVDEETKKYFVNIAQKERAKYKIELSTFISKYGEDAGKKPSKKNTRSKEKTASSMIDVKAKDVQAKQAVSKPPSLNLKKAEDEHHGIEPKTDKAKAIPTKGNDINVHIDIRSEQNHNNKAANENDTHMLGSSVQAVNKHGPKPEINQCTIQDHEDTLFHGQFHPVDMVDEATLLSCDDISEIGGGNVPAHPENLARPRNTIDSLCPTEITIVQNFPISSAGNSSNAATFNGNMMSQNNKHFNNWMHEFLSPKQAPVLMNCSNYDDYVNTNDFLFYCQKNSYKNNNFNNTRQQYIHLSAKVEKHVNANKAI